MERIKTHKLLDNEPLFISHYFKNGTLTLLLHKENQDLSNFFNVYGFLILEPSAPKPYNGIYLSSFYIQPQKETDNLKGMGKYMLCLAIAIYLKYYNFNDIYLRATSENNKKLIHYYSREYGFVVVDDQNPFDVVMKSNLQLLKENCLNLI